MKRQRIFSYILTFLIIGMCARNLSYVYALEENGGSASVFSEDAGQGETEEPMAEEKEEDPVPEEEMDAPQEEPPQEEPSGDEPPQEETPQEEPSGGEPGEPEAAGTGTEGSGDPARPGGTEGAGGPSDSGTQGGQTPEDSGDEDGSGNPDTPEKPAGSGEESGKGPEDEEIKEEPEEELEEEQDEVSEILTAADLFQLSGSSETAKVGEEFTLQAEVDLPEDEIASLQWQISWNGTDWEDIEEADGTEYSFLPEEKSFAAFYRLLLTDKE